MSDQIAQNIATFTLASLDAALDATPGSDDDMARYFDVIVESYDHSVPGQIVVVAFDPTAKLAQRYRVTVNVEQVPTAVEYVVEVATMNGFWKPRLRTRDLAEAERKIEEIGRDHSGATRITKVYVDA